jgi:type I restriction enzyme S subunit
MSAQALRVEERAVPYLVAPLLTDHLDTFASAPEGFKRLRELVLNLAVLGRLVPQDPNDEPAEKLLEKIQALKKGGKSPVPVQEDALPFSVPDGWRWVRLGTVCSYIQRGKSPAYSDRSDFPVVSQKCVRWYGLDLCQARFIQPDSIRSYEPVRFLRPGDVLWNSTGTGTIGRAVVVPSSTNSARLVADSHVTVIRPILFSPSFLWRWIQSPFVQNEIEGMASGTTKQIELNVSTVIAHLFPLPPLAEQSRIVAKVEELMALIDRLEEKVSRGDTARGKLLDTLLTALAASPDAAATADTWAQLAPHFDLLLQTPADVDRLQQTLLTLAVKGRLVPQDPNDEPAAELLKRIRAEKERLVAEGKIKRDRPLPAVMQGAAFDPPGNWTWVYFAEAWEDSFYGPRFGTEEYVVSGGVPTIRTTDMTADGRIELRSPPQVLIPPEKVDLYCLRGGDILVTRSGSIGTLALFDLAIKAVPSAYLIRLRPIKGIDPQYALLYLRAPMGQELLGLGTTSVGVPNVSASKMALFPFPLPPLPEQSRIVSAVVSLTALCDRLRERLAARRDLSAKLAGALTESALA